MVADGLAGSPEVDRWLGLTLEPDGLVFRCHRRVQPFTWEALLLPEGLVLRRKKKHLVFTWGEAYPTHTGRSWSIVRGSMYRGARVAMVDDDRPSAVHRFYSEDRSWRIDGSLLVRSHGQWEEILGALSWYLGRVPDARAGLADDTRVRRMLGRGVQDQVRGPVADPFGPMAGEGLDIFLAVEKIVREQVPRHLGRRTDADPIDQSELARAAHVALANRTDLPDEVDDQIDHWIERFLKPPPWPFHLLRP